MPAKRRTEYVLIPLTRDKFAKIDTDQIERVAPYGWMSTWSGQAWYATARVGGKQISLHRFLMNAEPGMIVDHENRDTLDCRLSNLRFANATESVANRRKRNDNTSGYIGVSWHKKAGKWRSTININRRAQHLGLFLDAESAARAYDIVARRLHGDFAQLNFP